MDVVPTLCYLLDIPMPEQVGGGVVYEALEDADWHLRCRLPATAATARSKF